MPRRGDLDVTHDLTIRGAGADVTTIDAASLDRVFHVLAGVTVELQDVTLTGGDPQSDGGGIRNEGTLTLTRCQISTSTATTGGALSNSSGAVATINATTLYSNSADNGGAIDNQGTLTLVNSTISGNEATANGGGIRNQSGTATLTNVTIAANTAATGGGICNSATATLHNTIVAENTVTTDVDFCGTVVSLGTNLVGDVGVSTGWIASDLLDTDSLLGPLQDNTGPTLTHALLVDSPAIDAGTDTGAPIVDQRGIARPVDGDNDDVDTTDMGAVERYYGEIHGVLFQDDNPNGIQEIREPGLAGRIVYLDEDDDGQLDPGEPLTTTMWDDPSTPGVDETGNYSFYNISPGTHRVAPLLPVGWEETYIYRQPQPIIERVSNAIEAAPIESNNNSSTPAINADGQYVAFASNASNLVPGDSNGKRDIFVLDQTGGSIVRVSVASDGTEADNHSYEPAISADGRFIAFSSPASNLVVDDTNGRLDIFVYDCLTRVTERVSISSDGNQANNNSNSPSISADGRYVTYWSWASNLIAGDTNKASDVFLYDRQTGTTQRLSVTSDGSPSDGNSYNPSISADGRYVAFESIAGNLAADDTSGVSDIFIHDRVTGITERVSVSTAGSQADNGSFNPSLSADGQYVAFESDASNLVSGDTNGDRDIFVRDRQTGTTERLSVVYDGTQANNDSYDPSLSADGRIVAFMSNATNLVAGDTNSDSDIFVHDCHTDTTERVSIASAGSQADDDSSGLSISGDGECIVFGSWATNLVAGDTNEYMDVFSHNRQTGNTTKVTSISYNAQAEKQSSGVSVNSDGRFVAFHSYASNLVAGDTNNRWDIFVQDLLTGVTERVSIASDGTTQANGECYRPSISADGRFVAFESSASSLAAGDTVGYIDVFVFDRQTRLIEQISVSSGGLLGDSDSSNPSISADGRHVVFESGAANLVPGDTNGQSDIFIHDRLTGFNELVSGASGTIVGNSGSFKAKISADNRYVAFHSDASNLVEDDTNGVTDIFVYDRQTGTTERVSLASDGSEANGESYRVSLSADGRYVAFHSDASNLVTGDTNGLTDVFVHDRQTGVTERLSVGWNGTETNGTSSRPSISGDGRYVAYYSDASNLVAGDTNGASDVFVLDRQTGNTTRVSLGSDASQANADSSYPAISADGRVVTFQSLAGNLVVDDTNGCEDIFAHDIQAGATKRISVVSSDLDFDANGGSYLPSISVDGRYVAFESVATNLVADDTNGMSDVFIYDSQTGTTERLSVRSNDEQGNYGSFKPSLSADGRYVVFQSNADLVVGDTNGRTDVYLHDCQTEITELVSITSDGIQADGHCLVPSISADGRYVVFESVAENLVEGDTNSASDIFVHDRQTGITERVSITADGDQANAGSYNASISADGRYVAYESSASNLGSDDTNGRRDVFVYDLQTRTTRRVSLASDGTKPDLDSVKPSITSDGRYVAFQSEARNLVVGDTGIDADIFIHDCQTGVTELVSRAFNGGEANSRNGRPRISADGRYIVFWSDATNLVPGDTNGTTDVFVHDRRTGETQCLSIATDGSQADSENRNPIISGNGLYVAFQSLASNFSPGDANGSSDIFITVNLPAWQTDIVAGHLGVGESITGMASGVHALPGEIHGQVFQDLNRNGTWNSGEPGHAQWTVYIDLDQDGNLDSDEPTAVTGTFGDFVFTDLAPFQTYVVTACQEDYWVQTSPTQANGAVWTVEIDAGTVVRDLEFGNYYAGPDAQSSDVVTGILYNDLNANGLQDDNEPGLAGWTVELNSEDGLVQDTAVTNGDGRYSFEGVTVRNYAVQLQAQTGWTLTTPLENSLSATSFGHGQFDQTQAVATGDFDGDSDSDIAVTHGEYVALLKNQGDGTFEAWLEISVGAGAYALVVGDFNQDGCLDLAVANYYASTLSVLLNQSSASVPFASAISTPVGSLPRSMATGQFNDDNHDGLIDDDDYLDIAIAHENGYSDVYVGDNQVSILRGNGDGTFQSPIFLTAGDSPVAIITAQFNDDNRDGWVNERDAVDLAVVNLDSNEVTIFVNDGGGEFPTGIDVPASSSTAAMPISLTAADLDRDGDLDLAVADLASDTVSILVNAGNGSFVRLPDALSAGTGPQAVIAADLEGDGDFDLIVTNNTADHLGILRNYTDPATGEIEFGPLESFGVANFSGGPSYSVVADFFNADSTLDLAVAIGETSLRVGAGETDGPQNYVSILLNDVFEGAHHITVTGIEPLPELNFGVRPEGDLPTIVGRYIFYNNSYYDGDDPTANAADDTAIATDKEALLPGELATFANYTNYTRGINGVMIDVADTAGTATIDDFSFLVGNSNDLGDWATLATEDLPAVTVRPEEGAGGADRITLLWPDNAIEQQWLQVTVLAGGNLGLVEDDVFYFGNAIGDSGEGNPSGVATTFISDELGARNNPHTFLDRAPVDDAYDYNRDSIVFISDELIARNNQTNFLTGLKLITAPASAPLAMSAAYVESDKVADATQSPQAEVDEYVDASMEETDASWVYYDWFDELDRANDDCDEDTEETGSLVDTLAMLTVDTRT